MAKILGTTENGFLVEMTPLETKKVSASTSVTVGTVFALASIYNKLAWIESNKPKIQQLSSDLRGYADGLDNVINVSGV